jgi:hypothetical protein
LRPLAVARAVVLETLALRPLGPVASLRSVAVPVTVPVAVTLKTVAARLALPVLVAPVLALLALSLGALVPAVVPLPLLPLTVALRRLRGLRLGGDGRVVQRLVLEVDVVAIGEHVRPTMSDGGRFGCSVRSRRK